ncbi:MAG: RNA polymerase sigma factor [Alistipes sp.]|nr:RNA polymerase sigma factor [Alistipes sp.]
MKETQTNIERLGEWIDLYQDQLFRYAFYRLGNHADAEDVLQDAFLKVASSSKEIRNPKAYLYSAVASGCVDMLRRRGKSLPIDEKLPSAHHADREDAEEEFRRIDQLLRKLPEQQSEVIRLHIHANLKFTEIADILEQPVTTIKSRFASGIEKLRKQFIN